MVVRAISGPEIQPTGGSSSDSDGLAPKVAADIAAPAPPAAESTTERPGGSARPPTRQISRLELAAHKKQLLEAETQLSMMKQVPERRREVAPVDIVLLREQHSSVPVYFHRVFFFPVCKSVRQCLSHKSRVAAEQKVQAVEEAINKIEVRCLGFIPATTAASGEREGYSFQADGPKGSGFYRDTSDMLAALKKVRRRQLARSFHLK